MHHMIHRLRNLFQRIRFSAPQATFDPPALFADERDCALSIMQSDIVQKLYADLGTDTALIQDHLQSMAPPIENPSLDMVLTEGSIWHVGLDRLSPPLPMELRLLAGLLTQGSATMRKLLTPTKGQPGDIPFYVTHRRWESELRKLWPEASNQTGDVLLYNDPFTPMEWVVEALQTSFALGLEAATRTMLKVHVSGSSVLKAIGPESVTDTCTRLNAHCRASGWPLYFAPQSIHVNQ